MKTLLLVQTGTPDQATPNAVREFLSEFLSDPFVVDVHPVLWAIVLNTFILPLRPYISAQRYKRFFAQHGRTLITHCTSLTAKLNEPFHASQSNTRVAFAMRYGNPSIESVIKNLVCEQGCDELVVLPLFPQYSRTTTGSIEAEIKRVTADRKEPLKLSFVPPFFDHTSYIAQICTNIETALQKGQQRPEKILLSYHGLPRRYVLKGDPYVNHCLTTTARIMTKLDYPSDQVLHTYQSRMGPGQWLLPDSKNTLITLAKQGHHHVMMVFPGFCMDCLETLDEIGFEAHHAFLKNGGTNLTLIPCLNDNTDWIKAVLEKFWN